MHNKYNVVAIPAFIINKKKSFYILSEEVFSDVFSSKTELFKLHSRTVYK